MDAVDLCAGDGWFTLPIARIARHVIAIDIDSHLLQATRDRLTAHGIGNCDFIAGDASDLPTLVRRPVDFVFLANAFHGVPDRPRLVRGVREILKTGGRLSIVNWYPRPREETTVLREPRGPRTELRLSPQQTIAAAEAGGLRFVRSVDLPPYHYGAIFERQAS
jgi:ubiquinone/menaquinone biosynthesis C-methylase UbiE